VSISAILTSIICMPHTKFFDLRHDLGTGSFFSGTRLFAQRTKHIEGRNEQFVIGVHGNTPLDT